MNSIRKSDVMLKEYGIGMEDVVADAGYLTLEKEQLEKMKIRRDINDL